MTLYQKITGCLKVLLWWFFRTCMWLSLIMSLDDLAAFDISKAVNHASTGVFMFLLIYPRWNAGSWSDSVLPGEEI